MATSSIVAWVRSAAQVQHGYVRRFEEYDIALTTKVRDGLYGWLERGGFLEGVSGRIMPALFPCVKERMLATSVVDELSRLCLDGGGIDGPQQPQTALVVERHADAEGNILDPPNRWEVANPEKASDSALIYGRCCSDVPGADAVNANGKLGYETLYPYGRGEESEVRRGSGDNAQVVVVDTVDQCNKSAQNHVRRRVLGPYMRYVVDRLISHFDPEDRGSPVGRKAMRKYAYNIMVSHGVRAYDIATHLDNVVAAAVLKVDASRQLAVHNVILELGGKISKTIP